MTRILIILGLLASLVAAGWALQKSIWQSGWDARESIAVAQALSNRANVAETKSDIVAANVADAQKRDIATMKKLEAVRDQQDALMVSLQDRLRAQEATPYKHPEKPNENSRPLLGQSVLDDGTIKLLDAARAGATSDPGATGSATGSLDAEGSAATATAPYVTGRQFAENDLKVVRQYHELATRHNDLVDWVENQCKRR